MGSTKDFFHCPLGLQRIPEARETWEQCKSKHRGMKTYMAVFQLFFWAEDRKVSVDVCVCVCVCVHVCALPSVTADEMLQEGYRHPWRGGLMLPTVQGRNLTHRRPKCGASGSRTPQPLPLLPLDTDHHWGPEWVSVTSQLKRFLRERESASQWERDTPTGLGWGRWLFHSQLAWKLHQPFSFPKAANVGGGCQTWIPQNAHPASY